MNQKINQIIQYAKTLGIVEVKRSSVRGDIYYGLPELSTESWLMMMPKDKSTLSIVNSIYISNNKISTISTYSYLYYQNYKFHLKELVKKARHFVLVLKEQEMNQKLEKINEDF